MSYNTNQKLLAFTAESTPGTRVALTYPADFDIRLYDVGDPSYDIPKEPIGEEANGTFRDGPAYSRERKINLPDCKSDFVGAGAPTSKPKNWKLAEACGMRSVLNVADYELVWDGIPACNTLSADLTMYTCGATPTAVREQARGVVGNIEIMADGPQAPIVMSFTSLQGAYLGQVDVGAGAIPVLTGNDTAAIEQLGKYTATIGGVVYAVQSFSFNTNNEINMEGANNDEGIATMKITNQAARLTMTVTRLDVASDDPVTDVFDNAVLSTITIAGGTGAHYDMTFTAADYVEIQPSDSSGTASYDLTFQVSEAKFAQKA